MRINSDRLIGVSQARQQLANLLTDVDAGKVFHLMRESSVIAHLVPVNTLILDNQNVENTLLSPFIEKAAHRFAHEIMDGGYLTHVGDDVGRVLAWLWDADPTRAVKWVGNYAHELVGELTEHRFSGPPFHQFWSAVSQGVNVALKQGEIDDFEAFARQHLTDWNADVFTASELAGDTRTRRRDDPWPDAPERGIGGYAKRRWCHLEQGQFIPDLGAGYELPLGAEWCRIEDIDGATATVTRSDHGTAMMSIDDVATWVPTVTREPYSWGRTT